MRASREGTARPVTVAEMIRSTSAGVSPAALRASTTACAPSSTAASMNASLASPKSASVAVLLQRQRQVPVPHAGVGVQPPQQPLVDATRWAMTPAKASVISSWA